MQYSSLEHVGDVSDSGWCLMYGHFDPQHVFHECRWRARWRFFAVLDYQPVPMPRIVAVVGDLSNRGFFCHFEHVHTYFFASSRVVGRKSNNIRNNTFLLGSTVPFWFKCARNLSNRQFFARSWSRFVPISPPFMIGSVARISGRLPLNSVGFMLKSTLA